jgi:hypothetical protein
MIRRHLSFEGKVDVNWNIDGSTAALAFTSQSEVFTVTLSAGELLKTYETIGHALLNLRPEHALAIERVRP